MTVRADPTAGARAREAEPAIRHDHPAQPPSVSLPRSVTDMRINLVGLACMLAAIAWLRRAPAETDTVDATILCMAAYALPIAALEAWFLRTWSHGSTGLDFARPRDLGLERSAVKLVGLATTLAMIGLAYAIFAEYQADTYGPFWALLQRWGWVAALAAVPYVVVVDSLMPQPRDGYWHVGALVLGRNAEEVDMAELRQHALGWLVKAFFLPLMFSYFHDSLVIVVNFDLSSVDFEKIYDFLWEYIHLIDVAIGVVGYLLTLRILDSHIRSTEPTVAGWVVALLCYPPFWAVFDRSFLSYHDDLSWWNWLEPYPWLRLAWGVAILSLVTMFALATVVFGLRFSNLTHRGIITGGPYRLFRHPAFISKLMIFGMINVPFVSNHGWAVALRHCARFGLVCLVYYLRAWTEERHLSRDPDYRAYAARMDRVGVTARLRQRLAPRRTEDPPAAADRR